MKNNNDIYKQQSIKQWTKYPIESRVTTLSEGSKEFFNAVTHHRYVREVPWMKDTFKFEQYKDKKVLEIGVGTGTDHLQFAKAGAILTGIDITPKSIELTKKNLEVHGYKSDLSVADAENLPFKNNTFDVIYSFGVLHHVPNTQKAIDEIYRVLKPRGKTIIALYHKYSLFWISVILYEMILKGGFFKKAIKQRLSEVEFGGEETKPLVRLYTKRMVKEMFNKFKTKKIYTRHSDIIFSGKRINKFLNFCLIKRFLGSLSEKWGWYLIIEAKK